MTFSLHRNLTGCVDMKESCLDLCKESKEAANLLFALHSYGYSKEGFKSTWAQFRTRTRVRIVLSDGEILRGYVGMSTGEKPCFLLVHSSRSTGGFPAPHPNAIASIWESKSRGKCLWARDSRQPLG